MPRVLNYKLVSLIDIEAYLHLALMHAYDKRYHSSNSDLAFMSTSIILYLHMCNPAEGMHMRNAHSFYICIHIPKVLPAHIHGQLYIYSVRFFCVCKWLQVIYQYRYRYHDQCQQRDLVQLRIQASNKIATPSAACQIRNVNRG